MQLTSLHGVFLAALLEKFIPVLPSYILFPAIGMSAASLSDLFWGCLVATTGSVGGAAAWYAVGALVGRRCVRRLVNSYGRWIFFSPRLYGRLTASYRRRPFAITLVGQLIPTVRIYQALAAGVLRLPLVPFLAATGAGAACWIVTLAGAGHALRRFGWSASEAEYGMLAVVMAVEGLALLIALSRRTRNDRQATARYGP